MVGLGRPVRLHSYRILGMPVLCETVHRVPIAGVVVVVSSRQHPPAWFSSTFRASKYLRVAAMKIRKLFGERRRRRVRIWMINNLKWKYELFPMNGGDTAWTDSGTLCVYEMWLMYSMNENNRWSTELKREPCTTEVENYEKPADRYIPMRIYIRERHKNRFSGLWFFKLGIVYIESIQFSCCAA